jgi:hypothetical protein
MIPRYYIWKTEPHWRIKVWTVQAHACNPTYPAGRDEKDHDLKPAWTNSMWDPILKISNTKQGRQNDSSSRATA